MPWGFLAAAVIAAGSSIIKGKKEQSLSRSNALAVEQMGRYNAAMAVRMSNLNAGMTLMTSNLNAALQGATSSVQAALIMREANFNAGLQFATANYNASLIERDEKLMWQEHDLNAAIYQKQIDQDVGAIVAAFAGSGIEIGNVGQAPEMAQINARTQGAMQLLIMKYGADVESKKLLEAAAQTRWGGAVQASAIAYQGKMQGLGAKFQGDMAALGMQTQGLMDAKFQQFQGKLNANAILYEAMHGADQFTKLGNAQFMNGLVNGVAVMGRGILSTYGASYTPQTSKYPSLFEGYHGPTSSVTY